MFPTIGIPSYIQGNFSVETELFGWLKNHQAIGFVGAGASADLYGTWNSLIYSLSNEAVVRGIASNDEKEFWIKNLSNRPQQVVKAIKNKLGDSRIFEDILK